MSDAESDVGVQTRQDLERRLDALSKKVENLQKAVMGDRSVIEVEDRQDVVSHLDEITAEIDEHSRQLQAFDEADNGSMTTQQRLTKIRRYLYRIAEEEDVEDCGIDYKEVRSLFDGEISPSWAAQLMKQAAGTFPSDASKPKEGFYYKDRGQKNNQIRVIRQKIEDRSFLRLKNSSEGGRG